MTAIWSIALHIGVGSYPTGNENNLKKMMETAIREGIDELSRISSKTLVLESDLISVAEQVVEIIEDSGMTNSGCGGHSNIDGIQVNDATLITSNGTLGAVTDTRSLNPIKSAAALARNKLLSSENDTPSPVFITGSGLDQKQKKVLKENTSGVVSSESNPLMDSPDTVGVVIYWNDNCDDEECKKIFISASSSGGFKGKPRGRVGAAGTPGAGSWASKNCAVSLSGAGEIIISELLAAKLSWFPNATRDVIFDFANSHKVPIGGIVLSPSSLLIFYNTQSLGISYASSQLSQCQPRIILFKRNGLKGNEWCSKPEIIEKEFSPEIPSSEPLIKRFKESF